MTPRVANAPILLFGGTSTIGERLAHEFARRGCPVILVARDEISASRVASDLSLRYGVDVQVVVADALDGGFEEVVLEELGEVRLGGVIWAWGLLGRTPTLSDRAQRRQIIDVNLTACVAAVEAAVPALDLGACIVLLSSVAGERGRRSNYIYGAAKAGLTVYGQGLNHRLRRTGIFTTVVKLGPVDTKMTAGMSPAGPMITADRAAHRIYQLVERRKSQAYVPSIWAVIMLVLRAMPEAVFQRLDI